MRFKLAKTRTGSYIPAMTTQPSILLVDDDDQALAGLQMILHWEGFSVRTATSGLEALAAIESEHPHVVLLDVRMPGLSGIDLASRLRAAPSTAAIRIVFYSAWPAPSVTGDCDAYDSYLCKPSSAAAIVSALKGEGDQRTASAAAT